MASAPTTDHANHGLDSHHARGVPGRCANSGRRFDFGDDAAVGVHERTAAAQETDGFATDADVAVEKQGRAPPTLSWKCFEHRSLQHGAASPAGERYRTRSRVDPEGDDTAAGQAFDDPAGTAADVEHRSRQRGQELLLGGRDRTMPAGGSRGRTSPSTARASAGPMTSSGLTSASARAARRGGSASGHTRQRRRSDRARTDRPQRRCGCRHLVRHATQVRGVVDVASSGVPGTSSPRDRRRRLSRPGVGVLIGTPGKTGAGAEPRPITHQPPSTACPRTAPGRPRTRPARGAR